MYTDREKKLQRLALFCAIVILLAWIGSCGAEEVKCLDMLPIIAKIESNGNALAWNRYSNAAGKYQITPTVLKEWNNNNPEQFVYDDLFDPYINERIAYWYLIKIRDYYLPVYNLPESKDYILIAYNWGIRNLYKWHRKGADYKRLPKETREYLIRYHKLEQGK